MVFIALTLNKLETVLLNGLIGVLRQQALFWITNLGKRPR